MNTTLTGKGFLDAVATTLGSLLRTLMERVFGPGVHTPALGDYSWADLGALACFVVLVLLANAVAASFIRRKIQQTEAQPESREWRLQLWRTVGRPFYLLIWVFGIYFAVTPLLSKLPAGPAPHPMHRLVDKLFDLGVFVVFLWLFLKFTHVLESRLKGWAGKTRSTLDDLAVPLLGRSLRVIVPVLGLVFSLPLIGLPAEWAGVLAKGSSILVIVTVAYILFQAASLGEKAVLSKYDVSAADNLQARKVHTQVHVLGRTAYVIIAIFSSASVLMLFEDVRQFGTSILASAGVLGIIIGFAAQRTIANLFAGLQLALTQPIRLDDVVIVEGEWGRIENISLTFVVVRIWDERRLIVPLSHFIEKPFQNWTHVSADILGSVFLWADYSLPISEMRPAVQKIVESCADWDKRFWNLQVTDASDRAMQLRILATASDASKAWNLRCEIREKVLLFIQQQHPQSLPKVRAGLQQDTRVPETGVHSLGHSGPPGI